MATLPFSKTLRSCALLSSSHHDGKDLPDKHTTKFTPPSPPKYLLWKKYCNYPLTTMQGDRLANCENIVSLSQTLSLPAPPLACFESYRVFSLTWPASMQIYCNKRKRLHKKRVQLPQDWFGTPTWPPFHCFGTPIWPPWRHVKTLHIQSNQNLIRRCLYFSPILPCSICDSTAAGQSTMWGWTDQ